MAVYRTWAGVILTILMAAAAAPAQADGDQNLGAPSPGVYVGFEFGYHRPLVIQSQSIGLAPDQRPYDWRWRLNSDWSTFARVGYRVSRHVRVEVEAGLRESNINSIMAPGGEAGGLSILRPQEPFALCDRIAAPPPCAKIGRPHINWAYADDGMANLLLDLAPERRLEPFVGVGAGVYHLQFDAHYYFSNVPGPITPTNPATQTIQLGGSINRLTQFAYQAIGGASYRLRRRLTLDLTYRYVCAPRLRWNTLNDTPDLTPSEGLQPHDFRGRAEDVSLTMGLRYAL